MNCNEHHGSSLCRCSFALFLMPAVPLVSLQGGPGLYAYNYQGAELYSDFCAASGLRPFQFGGSVGDCAAYGCVPPPDAASSAPGCSPSQNPNAVVQACTVQHLTGWNRMLAFGESGASSGFYPAWWIDGQPGHDRPSDGTPLSPLCAREDPSCPTRVTFEPGIFHVPPPPPPPPPPLFLPGVDKECCSTWCIRNPQLCGVCGAANPQNRPGLQDYDRCPGVGCCCTTPGAPHEAHCYYALGSDHACEQGC